MPPDLVSACLAMTAVTYLCRVLMTVSAARVRVPARAERFLSLIPFAVLAALVTPYLLTPGAGPRAALLNPYLAAGLPTLLIAWKSRNLLLAALSGLVLYLLLGLLI